MARFDKGWFCVQRRLFRADKQNNEWYGRGLELGVWLNLIAWANVRDGKTRIGRHDVIVRRGEVVTSYRDLADQQGISRQNVRTALSRLSESSKINTLYNTGGLHIRICNYERYQTAEGSSNTDDNLDLTRSQPGPNLDLTSTQHHIEQSNKENKETTEQELLPADVPPAGDEGGDVLILGAGAKRRRREVKRGAPSRSEPAKSTATLEAYAAAMYAMHRFHPLHNAPLRSQACKLVDLVGVNDAPAVAEYFVLNEKEAWVVKARHPFGELVKNAQKYYGNWKTGTKVSASMAKAVERNDANRNTLERLLAKERQKTTINGAGGGP